MLCSWDGDRRSGVTLAMHHRDSGLYTEGLSGHIGRWAPWLCFVSSKAWLAFLPRKGRREKGKKKGGGQKGKGWGNLLQGAYRIDATVRVPAAFNTAAELCNICKKRRKSTRHTVTEWQQQTAWWRNSHTACPFSSLAVHLSDVRVRKVADLQIIHAIHYTVHAVRLGRHSINRVV